MSWWDHTKPFFNGWTHDHYITNVFVFNENGTTLMPYFDKPQCVHFSQMTEWGYIYAKLEISIGCSVLLKQDLGTQRKISWWNLCRTVHFQIRRCIRKKEMMSEWKRQLHQSAEWGMTGFQASFPRMNDCIDYAECG